MPEQFKDITSFKAYQKQIYEYLNERMVQLPLFFSNQNAINNITLPSQTSEVGGNFQQTIRDGKVVRGRKIDEIFVSFDNVYSNNQNDLDVISYIANQLDGMPPSPSILDVDAFLWAGTNTGGLYGPISTSPIPETDGSGYGYIPYVVFPSKNFKKILLNFDAGINTIEDYFNSLNIPNTNFQDFKQLLLNENISLNLDNYNLSDNTENYLPVGIQKRRISKKVLKDSTETEISEILPESTTFKIQQFFKQWDKIKSSIPSGQEFIEGSTFLNSGNFAGGVGPGEFKFWLNETINGDTPLDVNELRDYAVFDRQQGSLGAGIAENLPNNSNWLTINSQQAFASQRVIEQDNPGFSPFVLATQRNAPTWYTINVEDSNLNEGFQPGLTYTISGWQTQDETFNQNTNYLELAPSRFFFFKLVAINQDGSETLVIDYPAFNLTQEQFLPLIEGQPVETWQGAEKLWTRYKKSFTIPTNEEGAIDVNGNLLGENWTGRYKLTWLLGYQNSLEDGGIDNGFSGTLYNGALLEGGYFDTDTQSEIWVGPTIKSNKNYASQYYTGLRINVGEQITSTTKLPLINIEAQTIARVLQDCVSLLETDFPNRNIPIYSEAKLQELILSQQNTALITNTLVEIKQGLINSIRSLTDGISETFQGIASSLIQGDDADAVVADLTQQFQSMIINTGIVDSINDLENTLTNVFTYLNTNTATLVNQSDVLAHYSEFPNISGYQAPGFKLVGPNQYGLSFDFGYEEADAFEDFSSHGVDAIDLVEQNLYFGNLAPQENIPFFLDKTNFYADGPDFHAYGGQSAHLRAYLAEKKQPFIFTDTIAYHIGTTNIGDDYFPSYNHIDNNTNNAALKYIRNGGPRDDLTFGAGDRAPDSGKYTEQELIDIKRYLNENGGVAIGAFYGSEMTTTGYNGSYRKGNPAQYLSQPNNYPGTGYGPYSAVGFKEYVESEPLAENYNQLFGNINGIFENGIERTKDIYNTFLNRFSEGNSQYAGPNETKQFEGLTELFNTTQNLDAAVQQSNYFAELETYTLTFNSGLEFMGLVYPYLLEDNPLTGYGYTNIDSLFSSNPYYKVQLKSQGAPNNQSPGIPDLYQIPAYARENFFHWHYDDTIQINTNNKVSNTDTYYGGPVRMRFYEPHWEWNPVLSAWKFRLAQPVIGSEFGPGAEAASPPYGESISNADIDLGFTGTSYFKFEKKFKFTKMAHFTKG